MSFRPLAFQRFAVPLAVISLVSACSENGRSTPLSEVDPVPPGNTETQTNYNIGNPTLNIPATFEVSPGDTLTLVWSDEFDGAKLDPETWFFATGDGAEKGLPGGWGNNELQYYLPDSAQLVDGVLSITARQETVEGRNYTSARINTEDRFAFKYGRIEASIKLPAGRGLWPAFWMLPQGSPYGGWAASGEIDIVETINLDSSGSDEIFGTIHFGGEFPANSSAGTTYTPSADITTEFHTYAVEWGATEIRWYFDGILYGMQNAWTSTAAPFPAPFDQPFHILLNLAVGGNFPGSPDGTTVFPATMEVDWVRVYSGEDVPSAPTEPVVAAPTPTETEANVISLFSDAYVDIAGLDYNPAWGQATVVTQVDVAGNNTLKYAGLNYQGIDFTGNAQDVSGMDSLHLDFWTADSTALNVFLISPGPTETAFALTVTPFTWVSVDIPLTAFAGVDLASVIQMKFDGNGTIFLDNLHFTTTGGGGPGPDGELAVNGDLETGDLSGWTIFDNGGTVAISSPGASSSGFAINADASGQPIGVTIKQANLGAGLLTPGQTVTVTFDWMGTDAIGGVVDVVLFSELSGGGVSATAPILGGAGFPAAWTTVGPMDITVGPDVSGGVTLQLTAICGGDPGCVSNIFFDNVSIKVPVP